jgi:hypothetical protein
MTSPGDGRGTTQSQHSWFSTASSSRPAARSRPSAARPSSSSWMMRVDAVLGEVLNRASDGVPLGDRHRELDGQLMLAAGQ